MTPVTNGIKKLFKIMLYFGIFEALKVTISSIIINTLKGTHVYKFIENYEYPICIRFNTNDNSVYHQIFEEREYSCLDDVIDAKLIIDCGAYTGFSSIWLLNKYNNAYIIAVEPDPWNFSICSKNLRPYKKRVKLIKAAVWPYRVGLVIEKEPYRDGREWTRQIRECKGKEKPCIKGVDIDNLINESGFEKVDILKIDIERSEIKLFSHNYEKWLYKVRNIVIELHDDECRQIFFKALSTYDYELLTSSELICCRKISRKISR